MTLLSPNQRASREFLLGLKETEIKVNALRKAVIMSRQGKTENRRWLNVALYI